MSNESDLLQKEIDKFSELQRRKDVVSEMDLTLKEHRVTRDLEQLNKNKEEMEQAKNVSFGSMSKEDIDKLVQENDDYMKAAQNAMVFINEEFKKIVPFFRKNLIVVGGDTGDGKSTAVSGIVFSAITRKNPATGKPCKCLVITNEEAETDVINRITCLLKGWKYTNHDQFSEEQRNTFKEFIPKWANNGRLTVIGNTYQGVPNISNSVEGIEQIFNNLLEDHRNGRSVPDLIILDYYQNVNHSKIDPKLDEFGCQRKLSSLLDKMKLLFPGPIVVMAQMKKLVDEEDSTPFNVRLKGSKLICDKATFICELIPERKLLRSKWKVWKSRFTEAVGQSIYTGYDRGKFVKYDIEFQKNVAKIIEKNLEKDKEQELGISADKKEDEKDIDET